MRATFILLMLLIGGHAMAQDHPFEIAQRATAAYDAGRYAEAADLFARVTTILPRSTAARINAARALARAGRSDAALAQLAEAVAFGVRFDPADDAWKPLRDDPRYQRLESRMRTLTAPVARSSVAFTLPKDFIPENVAFDPKSGAFFVGSMYKAKISRISADGNVTDFVPSRRDGLLAVLGMKVDPARRELWAASSNFGETPPLEMDDAATVGKGGLFRYALDSGKLIGTYWGPGTAEAPVQFNDLVIAPGGDVYATAGLAGIWRVGAGDATIEPFVTPRGTFFNGIAITPDGRTIFAASHFDGVMKIDVATGTTSYLELPAGVAMGGIDGLYVYRDSLIAIQNGTDPIRVIRASLDPSLNRVTRFEVLEQEHPETDIPLTGTIVGDDFYYVGRSQLRAFDGKRIWSDDKLKPSTILRLPLNAGSPRTRLKKE